MNVVDVIRYERQTKDLVLHDVGFSRKAIQFFKYDNFVHPLLSCDKSMNLCKFDLMNIKRFECLFLWTRKPFWFDMFDLLKHIGVSNQTRVFKPGV